MNRSIGVPVLISSAIDGNYVARIIDGPPGSAIAPTRAEALKQIRNYCRRLASRGDSGPWPDGDRYELRQSTVAVRMYRGGFDERIPISREFRLPVRMVVAASPGGGGRCFLPEHHLSFYYPSGRELDALVAEHVRYSVADRGESFGGLTPPPTADLVQVRVTVRDDLSGSFEPRDVLDEVAEPLHTRVRGVRQTVDRFRTALVAAAQRAICDGPTLVIGETGCGKTTVLRTVARNLAETPNDSDDAVSTGPQSIVQTSATHLIAGMAYLGQWQERVEQVIAAADDRGCTVAFESLADLIGADSSSASNSVAAFLEPYIAAGEFRVVIEATEDEWIAARRRLPSFVDLFTIIRVPPLSVSQTTQIIDERFASLIRDHRVEVDTHAASTLATLSARFSPGSAAIRTATSIADSLMREATEHNSIRTEDVTRHVTQRTGLPAFLLDDSISIRRDELIATFARQVIGQREAVAAAADVVLKLKSGLNDPHRPIASMMFCGPTGVGKTQLARTLAEYLFGERESEHGGTGPSDPLIRLDMSEYGGYDAVTRMTHGADGEIASWLSNLRRHPLSVILLDEFDKASPAVHDLWMSALDEGRMTDPLGRTTTLCGSIIIATTNAGTTIKSPIGLNERFNNPQSGPTRSGPLRTSPPRTSPPRTSLRAVQETFRLEFLNRLDRVLIFDALTFEQTRRIVAKELNGLTKREAVARAGVRIGWNDAVVDAIADAGFDSAMGARPLQRLIDQTIVPAIARWLLSEDRRGQTFNLHASLIKPRR